MDSPGTLLIVDDEAPVRRLLRRCFENERYRIFEAANGPEALELLAKNDIDLMTLDLNLGGEDGLHVARQVRAFSRVAIIIVSGKGDLIDKVVGLEVGADDYIAKPFELREVLARVRSVLRRTGAWRSAPTSDSVNVANKSSVAVFDTPAGSEIGRTDTHLPALVSKPVDRATPLPMNNGEPALVERTPAARAHGISRSDERYRFAGCALDVPARELRGNDGEPLELTTGEFNLLHLFLRSGRQALSRDQIMDALKGTDWHPNDRTIDNHVARLRRKLEAGGAVRAIRTIRGIGYQFTTSIERVCDTGR